METAMSQRKYELRRICQNLADKFPHFQATADQWAAYDAVKGEICNRKAERKRTARLREANSASKQSNGNEAQLAHSEACNSHSSRALGLAEARRGKAAGKGEATAPVFHEEDVPPRTENTMRASPWEASIPHPSDEIGFSITDQKRLFDDESEDPTERRPPNEDKACSSEDDVLPGHSANVLLKLKVKNTA
ncbi:hypothetical protein BWQ96_03763 [Gracilariopsis chorda]|uniref:Uncharacterized protein n=1 Tax=Gracilariopsis chorda TaxID=448386 RepID=A0A2V3IWL5_9FLOR|nr:hypothetical protein BWQ96_03763 [Gracilariopsis chorda]|eukprot:PXF46528.1 hypothetical protein BWQ96_03763 [Gracilariopsis chorda]